MTFACESINELSTMIFMFAMWRGETNGAAPSAVVDWINHITQASIASIVSCDNSASGGSALFMIFTTVHDLEVLCRVKIG